MRFAFVCLAALLAPALGAAEEARAPFPLPTIDDKQIPVAPNQTSFRLPMKFARVETFYCDQLKGKPKISFKASGAEGARILTIESKRAEDAWAKAVVKEGEVATTVDVTFVLVMSGSTVSGTMPPVLFIPRSAEAAKTAESIEHLEHAR